MKDWADEKDTEKICAWFGDDVKRATVTRYKYMATEMCQCLMSYDDFTNFIDGSDCENGVQYDLESEIFKITGSNWQTKDGKQSGTDEITIVFG